MNDIDSKILEKIISYQGSIDEIQKRRATWNQSTKDLIYKVLTEIKIIKNLNWHVQKEEDTNNMQTVNLIFNKSHSDIVQSTGNSSKAFTKCGGGLFFSQAYNGNIFVFIEYPYVESWVSQMKILGIEKVSPEKITEEYIKNQVVRFLEEMTKWEQSTSKKNPLGYKTNNSDF